jgi:hypothetical protein
VALVSAATLSGCADYLNHRDSVTLAAGNAPETNLAIHTVNPFPPEAWNTTIIADGKPVDRAQTTYNGKGKGQTIIPIYVKGPVVPATSPTAAPAPTGAN